MNRPFDPVVQQAAVDLYRQVDVATTVALTGIHANGIHDKTSALYTALMAAAGPLSFAARLISGNVEQAVGDTPKELILAAALILGRVVRNSNNGITVDFTPRNVLAALEAASKIAGFDVKPLAAQGMIASYTQGVAEEGLSLGYWDHRDDNKEGFDGKVIPFPPSPTRH